MAFARLARSASKESRVRLAPSPFSRSISARNARFRLDDLPIGRPHNHPQYVRRQASEKRTPPMRDAFEARGDERKTVELLSSFCADAQNKVLTFNVRYLFVIIFSFL